jgi:hypothetical protein
MVVDLQSSETISGRRLAGQQSENQNQKHVERNRFDEIVVEKDLLTRWIEVELNDVVLEINFSFYNKFLKQIQHFTFGS